MCERWSFLIFLRCESQGGKFTLPEVSHPVPSDPVAPVRPSLLLLRGDGERAAEVARCPPGLCPTRQWWWVLIEHTNTHTEAYECIKGLNMVKHNDFSTFLDFFLVLLGTISLHIPVLISRYTSFYMFNKIWNTFKYIVIQRTALILFGRFMG